VSDVDDDCDWTEGQPAYTDLPQPRSLTSKERALLDVLLSSPRARDELREQVKSVQVVAACWCGCPSVNLAVDPGAPRAEYPDDEQLPRGVVTITAWQRKSRWPWTEVTLHIIEGELFELEIWGGRYGLRPRVDPARLEFDPDGDN